MKRNNYNKFINEYIESLPYGTPIYSKDLSVILKDEFQIDAITAQKQVNLVISRMTKAEKIARYQRGIYYKPKRTAFGLSKLNPKQLITENYLKRGSDEIGYETGPSLLNHMGLSTQVPKYTYVTTNNYHKYGENRNEKLKLIMRKPVTQVNAENKQYLQLLDILQNKDKTPIDIDNLEDKLLHIVKTNNINLSKLIAYSAKYYPKDVVYQVALIAARIEI